MDIRPDFERNETYECGAALLAVLAYPGPSDDDKRAELLVSLCGKSIWIKFLSAPDDMTPVPVKLPYVFRDTKRVDRDVRTIERRIGERMVAGRMAVPFLWHAEMGDELLLPRGLSGFRSIRWPSTYLRTPAKPRRATSRRGSGALAVR